MWLMLAKLYSIYTKSIFTSRHILFSRNTKFYLRSLRQLYGFYQQRYGFSLFFLMHGANSGLLQWILYMYRKRQRPRTFTRQFYIYIFLHDHFTFSNFKLFQTVFFNRFLKLSVYSLRHTSQVQCKYQSETTRARYLI